MTKLYCVPPEEAEAMKDLLEVEERHEADVDIDVHAEGEALARTKDDDLC